MSHILLTILFAVSAVLCDSARAQGVVSVQETPAAQEEVPVRKTGAVRKVPEVVEAPDPADWYLAVGAGLSSTDALDWREGDVIGNIEVQKGANYAGALGFKVSEYLSTELEVSYRTARFDELSVIRSPSSDLGGGEDKVWGGMLNVNIVPFPGLDLTPFLTVGMGIGRHDVGIAPVTPIPGVAGVSDVAWMFAYQWGLGLNYDLKQDRQLWLGWRYFATQRPEIGATEFEYASHEIRIGMRQHF